VEFCLFEGEVSIQWVKIGNKVLDALEAKKLMSPRIRESVDPRDSIGRALMQEIQRMNPGKDLRIENTDDYPGIEFDEVDSEYAPLFKEEEELKAKQEAMEKEWHTPGWKITPENEAAYYAVVDRLWELEHELNSYPTPKRTKRLVRT
jgi:hypothetical protein